MTSPTVTPLSEAFHNGGFIVSEANGHRSRDPVTLLSGLAYLAGMVMGTVTTGLTAAAAALGTNVGNGTFGAVTLVTTATQVGVYSLVYTSATAFTVTAPDGDSSTGTNGVAFSALGIGFTMTTGATPMVAGDGFTITVTGAVGKPTAASVANGGNTGNSTSSAVTTTGYAPAVGVYKVTFARAVTDLGTFVVEDPDGAVIGHGVVGTAYAGGGLSFTIADGSTDFVGGDQFTVTVAAGSGKATQWNPSAVNGSQIVSGVLFASKNAVSADQPGLLMARSCEVNASELVWPTSANAATITAGIAALARLGIVTR